MGNGDRDAERDEFGHDMGLSQDFVNKAYAARVDAILRLRATGAMKVSIGNVSAEWYDPYVEKRVETEEKIFYPLPPITDEKIVDEVEEMEKVLRGAGAI